MAGIIPYIIRNLMVSLIVFLHIFYGIAFAETVEKEYAVKAAFLYNFIKFVTWTGDYPGDEIGICAFGDSINLGDLRAIEGKKAWERTLKVYDPEGQEKHSGCRVIFIGKHARTDFRKILADSGKSGILTVSDIDGFAENGGMIELFTTDDNRIRFKINIGMAEQNGLKISSELLKHAVITGRSN